MQCHQVAQVDRNMLSMLSSISLEALVVGLIYDILGEGVKEVIFGLVIRLP